MSPKRATIPSPPDWRFAEAFAIVTGTTLLVTGFRMRRRAEDVAEQVAGRSGKSDAS